jgi:hypothetical protein
MEARQQAMIDTALAMKSALKSWDLGMNGMTVSGGSPGHLSRILASADPQEWQYDVLLDIQHRLGLYNKQPAAGVRALPDHRSHAHDQHANHAGVGASSNDRATVVGDIGGRESSWTQPIRFIIAQAVFLAIVVIVRRVWNVRNRSKVL